MSELARRKDSRDLWVSRSHLHAAVVFAFLLAIASFGVGYGFGRSKVSTAEPQRHATLVGEDVPGEELVELLATVQRTAMVHPSSAMEYPQWAEGAQELPLPEHAPPVSGVRATVPAPPLSGTPEGDTLPAGSFTVSLGTFADVTAAHATRDALAAQGQPAFASLRLEDGVQRWWVGVGGYRDEAAALQAVEAIAVAASQAAVQADVPEVLALPTPSH